MSEPVSQETERSRYPPPLETSARSEGWRVRGRGALDEKEEEEGFCLS